MDHLLSTLKLKCGLFSLLHNRSKTGTKCSKSSLVSSRRTTPTTLPPGPLRMTSQESSSLSDFWAFFSFDGGCVDFPPIQPNRTIVVSADSKKHFLHYLVWITTHPNLVNRRWRYIRLGIHHLSPAKLISPLDRQVMDKKPTHLPINYKD